MVFPMKNVVFFTIFLAIFTYCDGERTKDRMYIDIKASTSCFRKMNATHQIGCSSKRGGATGVLHFCTGEKDLNFILKNGSAGPYIPVIPASIFNKQNVKLLETSQKVSGLLLYLNNETLLSFTHDLECPNENYGVQNTCGKKDNQITWNPFGTGLIFEDIKFPVFYIDNVNEIQAIRDCFRKFNNFSYETQRDRSLCSAQLNSFMFGAKNTPTCIRRSNLMTNLNPVRVCDPLGGKNIWSTLFPLAKFDEKTQQVKPILGQKYIILASRSDTTSMFDRTAGADSPITGLVTLLTVAKILKNMLPSNQNYDTNVLFVIFNGESYDYMGSQRMIYDMERGNFPVQTENGTSTLFPVIKIEDIVLFVELNQLSKGDGSVFVHRYKVDQQSENFINLLKTNMETVNLEVSDGTLPPSSVQTFIKKYENISSVVLTNHKTTYTNHFYNSIFDNSTNIEYKFMNGSSPVPPKSVQRHLYNVANAISKSVYQEITGHPFANQNFEFIDWVDELLHCYLEDQNCKIHQAVGKQPLDKNRNIPINLYVGVDGNTNEATTLLGLILGWFTGDVVGQSNQNCTNISKNYAFRFYNVSIDVNDLNKTMCIRTVMNFTEAVSPAFIIDDYDWSSNLYSSWSESTWGEINMRLFLKPSAAHESMTIAVGSITLIFSFLIVYFVKSRSDILFVPQSTQPTPVDC